MRRIAILAEGYFDWQHAKTAVGVLRYSTDMVLAIIDSTRAGTDAAIALGDPAGPGRGVPIVADVAAALALGPDTLLIGIAPAGGRLPAAWTAQIVRALEAGLEVVSGLHTFLADDPALAAAVERGHGRIWDVRRPPEALATRIRTGEPHRAGSRVVSFVGSDCNVGKMTAAVEFDRAARERGLRSAFAATGQTGIMIAGNGVPADRVISDFLPGAVEAVVQQLADEHDWVWVEGQGALGHPAYSAVTLGLLHGAAPDLLVLCHHAGRETIYGFDDMPIPPLTQVRAMYETAAAWLRPAPVVAVALNTYGMSDDEARAAVAAAAEETGLPTSDPVRFGVGPLLDALVAHA